MNPSARSFFVLQPDISYFDHGGYSLPFHDVLRYKSEIDELINKNPSYFFRNGLIERLDVVRDALGAFLRCSPSQISFVQNATYAFETILKNLDLKPGDAVLINNLTFYANRRALQALVERLQIELIDVRITLPVNSTEEILEAVTKAFKPQVKLAVIDHISSPSGIVFPVREVCQFLQGNGVTVVVDGAQSPGQIPVNLADIPCDFFYGNAHKWMTAPRTCAFLFVHDRWRNRMRGLVSARSGDFADQGRSDLQKDTDWPGAYDPTPILAIPKALEKLGQIYPGGVDQLMLENHKGLLQGIDLLSRHLSVTPVADPSLFGSMGCLRLNHVFAVDASALQRKLLAAGVVAMIYTNNPGEGIYIRFCHQAYIGLDDYQKAADALVAEIS